MSTLLPPVFVLAAERTGSTLLRYALDTHPEVYCPDELNLGRLCSQLADAIEGAYAREGEVGEGGFLQVSAETLAETRRIVSEIMDTPTRALGKKIWCEKSPTNLGELAILERLFPEARYISLYRHCLDFARSCLQACKYRFWPGLAPYVVRSPQNLIDAMAQAWIEKTETALEFERKHGGRCFRMRYESLVTDPENSLRALFGFLEVGFRPALVGRIFTRPHAHRTGHGDENTRLSARIHDNRLGLGNEMPWRERLSQKRIREINALLEELGYPPLRPAEESYSLGFEPASHASVENVQELFERDLPGRLAAQPGLVQEIASAFRFVVTGPGGGDWVVDLTPSSGPAVRAGAEAPATITVGSTVLLDVINGRLGTSTALRDGTLKVEGVRDPSGLLRLVHVLSAPPS